MQGSNVTSIVSPPPNMAEPPKVPLGDIYESMCVWLYAYRFGTIGFLDLLGRFEEILWLSSPQTGCRNALEGKE
jgi:hypothetical protein